MIWVVAVLTLIQSTVDIMPSWQQCLVNPIGVQKTEMESNSKSQIQKLKNRNKNPENKTFNWVKIYSFRMKIIRILIKREIVVRMKREFGRELNLNKEKC